MCLECHQDGAIKQDKKDCKHNKLCDKDEKPIEDEWWGKWWDFKNSILF